MRLFLQWRLVPLSSQVAIQSKLEERLQRHWSGAYLHVKSKQCELTGMAASRPKCSAATTSSRSSSRTLCICTFLGFQETSWELQVQEELSSHMRARLSQGRRNHFS